MDGTSVMTHEHCTAISGLRSHSGPGIVKPMPNDGSVSSTVVAWSTYCEKLDIRAGIQNYSSISSFMPPLYFRHLSPVRFAHKEGVYPRFPLQLTMPSGLGTA